MVTRDGGESWNSIVSPDGAGMYDAVFTDLQTGYMIGDRGTIMKFSPAVGTQSAAPATLPQRIILHGNYPNPFNPRTALRFSLDRPAAVSIRIYNSSGQKVYQKAIGQRPAGDHEAIIDGTAFSSGTYFYRLVAHEDGGRARFSNTRKMTLIR